MDMMRSSANEIGPSLAADLFAENSLEFVCALIRRAHEQVAALVIDARFPWAHGLKQSAARCPLSFLPPADISVSN